MMTIIINIIIAIKFVYIYFFTKTFLYVTFSVSRNFCKEYKESKHHVIFNL